MLRRAFARWGGHPCIEILGNPDPDKRVGIVSFIIRDPQGQFLHPRLITTLLNDLFGIQSRAGCSCAGPYGHQLLGIDEQKAAEYRAWINRGYHGVKPGWCRVGFHFVFDDAEVDYLIDAVLFIADQGHRFVHQYGFDARSGGWQHRDWQDADVEFSLQASRQTARIQPSDLTLAARKALYRKYLDFASACAGQSA